jgi:3-oxoacyl-[acyl-carrier-protein] synthase-1
MPSTRGEDTVIGRIGMVTPVGMTAAASCAAMRAGVSRIQELSIEPPITETLMGAYLPYADSGHADVFTRLLSLALEEVIAGSSPEEISNASIVVAIPHPARVGRPPDLDRYLLPRLHEALGIELDKERTRVIAMGRESYAHALRLGRRLLHRRSSDRCIVAAVDSLVDETTVGWLYQTRRLKTPDNPDGLYPGEAAVAIELRRSNADDDLTGAVHIAGIGFGNEPHGIETGRPSVSEGLTAATVEALSEAGTDFHHVAFRLSDVTGEQYFFRELSNVLTRLQRRHKEEFQLWHCADSIGDTGAASGGVLAAMAAFAFRKGYAPGDVALCHSSDDAAGRASFVLRHGSGHS